MRLTYLAKPYYIYNGKTMRIDNSPNNEAKVMGHYSPLFFQNPGYENGNTLLHVLIKKCCEPIFCFDPIGDALAAAERISTMIDNVGHEAAVAMSLIKNDAGNTPIQMLYTEFKKSEVHLFSTDKFNKLYLLLIDLMQGKQYAPIKKPLNLHDVLAEASEYQELNPRFKRNLIIATYITNFTRNVINDSYSHPQFNGYDVDAQKALITKIEKYRDDMARNAQDIQNLDHLENRHTLITVSRVGNCMEYSGFAFIEMRRLNFGVRTEMISLQNGDHVFLLLDRNNNSDLNQIATWGNDAVICDPWSGAVYPAEAFLHQYADLVSVRMHSNQKRINAIVSFNPRYHQLECYVELPTVDLNAESKQLMEQACSEEGHIYKYANSECREIERPQFKAVTDK